jgi:hypothetical protein
VRCAPPAEAIVNDIDALLQGACPAQTTSGLTDVVGELSFDTPIALADLMALEQSCVPCFATHRVQLVGLFLARDRRRAVLLFRAPDAESVRLACRHATLPFERVWQCPTPIIKRSLRGGRQHENE